MDEINLEQLSSAKFEALCSTLLIYEDQSIRTFLREGPDAAIDALSADGSTVFQFKFHQNNERRQIFSDAKSEVEKIRKYKQGKDSRANIWKKVKNWTLITNLSFNPQTDSHRWNEEIAPKFKDIGIKADIWGKEKLLNLLVKHQDVYHAFFKTGLRSLITIPEAIESLSSREIQAGEMSIPFVGRKSEVKQVIDFFHDEEKRMLTVIGSGGIGKSRFLIEAGCRMQKEGIKDIYWANVSTLESNKSFPDLIPSRKTVLLIDEPSNITFLKSLIEQLQLKEGPLKNLKVIFAIRPQSPQISSILYNKTLNISSTPIKLEPLKKNDCIEISRSLLKNSEISLKEFQKISSWLFKLSGGYPIWISIGVRLITESKPEPNLNALLDMPKDQYQLASKYISQIIQDASSNLGTEAQIDQTLIWIALFKEIRLEDTEVIQFITNKVQFTSKQDISELIEYLYENNLLHKLGRIYRIKPDVIRDYLLVKKLTKNGNPSFFAEELNELILKENQTNPLPNVRDIITSLSDVELLEKLSNKNTVSLLDPLVEEIKKLASSDEAKDQMNAVIITEFIATVRPKDVVIISSIIRTKQSKPSEIQIDYWGSKTIEHKDVVLKLPWIIYEASRYAIESDERKALLEELFYLSKYESLTEPKDDSPLLLNTLPNAGQRTSNIFEKLISSGPDFAVSFEKEVFDLVKSKFSNVSKESKKPELLKAFKKLVYPFLSIKREYTEYKEGKIFFTTYILPEDTLVFKKRKEFLSMIWEKLLKSKDQDILCFALDLIMHSHNSTHHALRYPLKTHLYLINEELNNLDKIRDFLKRKDLPISVLRKTKDIWEWHAEYDERKHLKNIARECKDIFLKKPKIELLSKLFEYEIPLRRTSEQQDYPEQLVNMILSGTYDFKVFIKDVKEYVDKDERRSSFSQGVLKLSPILASQFDQSKIVYNFVLEEIINSGDPYLRNFAINILAKVFENLREADNKKSQSVLFDIVKSQIKTKSQCTDLLFGLYAYFPSKLNEFDFKFITELLSTHLIKNEDINEQELRQITQIIPSLFSFNKVSARDTCNELLKKISITNPKQELIIINNFIHCIWIQCIQKKVEFHNKDIKWLISVFYKMYSLELETIENLEWKLNQLFNAVNWYPGLKEFRDFIMHQRDYFKKYRNKTVPITKNILKIFPNKEITDSNKKNISQVFNELLELNNEGYPFGYYLPEWLQHFDPYGILLPEKICCKIESVKLDYKEICLWSRYTGTYPENSDAWRKIAITALEKTQDLNNENRQKIFRSFRPRIKTATWSGPVGEFPHHWQMGVDEAKEKYDKEKNEFLKEYYRLRLNDAQSILKEMKLRHIEEFGDEQPE